MKDYFSTHFKLGVLGGGQLGKMLLTETRKYDIYTCILDPSPEAPCRIGSNEFYTGDLKDYQTVYDFGKKVGVLARLPLVFKRDRIVTGKNASGITGDYFPRFV